MLSSHKHKPDKQKENKLQVCFLVLMLMPLFITYNLFLEDGSLLAGYKLGQIDITEMRGPGGGGWGSLNFLFQLSKIVATSQ